MRPWERELIQAGRVAHLATVDPAGQPHVVPVVYVFDGWRVLTPLDGKPKRVAGAELRRARNILAGGRAALVVDAYAEDWRQLAWVQIRGPAGLLDAGEVYEAGLALLFAKYPQYAEVPLAGRPLIAIEAEQVRSWRMSDG